MGIAMLVIVLSVLFFLYIDQARSALPNLSLSNEDFEPFLKNLNLEKERKRRFEWLISFIIWVIVDFISTMFLALENVEHKPINYVLCFLIPAFLKGPVYAAIYYCSYKKRGTCWLVFLLIVLTPQIPFILYTLILVPGFFLSITLLSLTLFWIGCFRYYRVNSARNYQKVLAFKHKYGPDADGFCSI